MALTLPMAEDSGKGVVFGTAVQGHQVAKHKPLQGKKTKMSTCIPVFCICC